VGKICHPISQVHTFLDCAHPNIWPGATAVVPAHGRRLLCPGTASVPGQIGSWRHRGRPGTVANYDRPCARTTAVAWVIMTGDRWCCVWAWQCADWCQPASMVTYAAPVA
jgi:hypothetical protein